jgi:hypothetical protein
MRIVERAQLRDAAKTGKVAEVGQLIESGANKEVKDGVRVNDSIGVMSANMRPARN